MAFVKKKEDKSLGKYLDSYDNYKTYNTVTPTGVENKETIENKVQTPVVNNNTYTNASNNIDIIDQTQQPLKNAYDNMKAQLELDKVSAQNELANAGKLAKTYMDNYLKYYGMQGSGMGQSAYANLAAKQTQGLADINKEFNRDLSDYRTNFNEGLQNQAAKDMLTMTPEQQQAYIDKLRGQSGVDEQTLSNIQSEANAINYEKEQAKNESILTSGENYAATFGNDKWNSYLNRLENEGVSQDTINSLKDIREYYYSSSFETLQNDSLDTLEEEIKQAKIDGEDVEELKEIYSKVYNASNSEELDEALKEWKNYETKDYRNLSSKIPVETAKPLDFGKPLGSEDVSSAQSKYTSKIIQLAKEGKIEDGTYVKFNYGVVSGDPMIYKLENGNWVKVESLSAQKQKSLLTEGKFLEDRNYKTVLNLN